MAEWSRQAAPDKTANSTGEASCGDVCVSLCHKIGVECCMLWILCAEGRLFWHLSQWFLVLADAAFVLELGGARFCQPAISDASFSGCQAFCTKLL